MTDRVTVTIKDGIADVRMNRPDKINACDPAMFAGLRAAIDTIAETRAVRVVVLSGEGRGFGVGVDTAAFDGDSDDSPFDPRPRTHGPANAVQQVAWGWRCLPQPVIAAVHGYAFGAGFQIMLGADIRIVAPDAQLSLMEARWGLVPSLAGFALLRGLVRDDVARELVYSGRRFNGEEAGGIGVVTRIDADPRACAMRLARDIAANSPDALRAAKRLFALAADGSAATLLQAESNEQDVLLRSANHREAVLAARDKRAPRFVD